MKHRNALLLLLAVYLFGFVSSAGLLLKITLWFGLWYLTGGKEWCRLAKHTWRRDVVMIRLGLKVLFTSMYIKRKNKTTITLFRETYEKYRHKTMFINEADDKKWTYEDMEKQSNRAANYFLSQGFKKGDCVAFYMGNRPEYVAIWLGLAKIGVIPAFINYNLRSTSLQHTINVAKCQAVIYGLELEEAIADIYDDLLKARKKFPAYFSKSSSGLPSSTSSVIQNSIDLDKALLKASALPEPKSVTKSISITDPLLYIYTSGTTGLPKAVNITHMRHLFASLAPAITIGLTDEDIVYCTLPLYHSSGGQIGIAGAMFYGVTTVIRRKFSASNFWTDCKKYNATAANYIGELCRYLMMVPPSPQDRDHKVRIMFGNGLRASIWQEFVDRFNIKDIAEFYGATEGNSNVINVLNKVGAIGFVSVIIPRWVHHMLLPLYIIKIDKDNWEPARGPDGLCIEAAKGEPGEFIGKIIKGDPIKDFVGYKDDTATTKKIVRDVFEKGDIYFRSGDILYMDEFGWIFFKDRIGDTFRWKGENVSTNEVEATISSILKLKDATSYGVEIPGTDGRAGMVAIPAKSTEEVDLTLLAKGCKEKLPSYARPIFVRLVKEVEITSTYKLKKTLLQKQGFDVTQTKDPVFFFDAKKGYYVPLTKEMLEDLMQAKIKL